MKNKILVIDSGFGGVSTLSEMRRIAPKTNFLYFGDDDFMPYGDKPVNELLEHLNFVLKSFESEIRGVVLACNTATGVAVKELRKRFPFPIVGTEPAIVPACGVKTNVLAVVTPLEARQEKFLRLTNGKRVLVLPEPNLAWLIDKHFGDGGKIQSLPVNYEIDKIVEKILNIAGHIDDVGIVLGCTHYVFLKYTRLFEGLPLFDGNVGVARRVLSLFGDSGNGSVEFVFGSGNKKKSQIALRLLTEINELSSSF